MDGYVAVSSLVAPELWHVIQIITAYNSGFVHLCADDYSFQRASSDGEGSVEGTVSIFTSFSGFFQRKSAHLPSSPEFFLYSVFGSSYNGFSVNLYNSSVRHSEVKDSCVLHNGFVLVSVRYYNGVAGFVDYPSLNAHIVGMRALDNLSG